ncbi:MAG: hypothetical protein DRI89_02195 [Bacteroidetes bacterium]|nr:MAG: hypothetical protein DRI89_02195 [Bacteroidota bacterium]
MDLQTRKISFVQEFLNLQSEEIILQFEKLLRREKKKISSKELNPMTLEEFNSRIDTSLEDSGKGRLTESSELLSEIEKWS